MSELDFEAITDELNYLSEIRKESEDFNPDDPRIEWKRPAKTIITIDENGKKRVRFILSESEGDGKVAHFTVGGDEW